jgi:uncharacterized protein GlcG (DUF336 family)
MNEMSATITNLTLEQADGIATAVLKHGAARQLAALAVAVLDPRGVPLVIKSHEKASLLRWEIAHAKAWGAIAMGSGSRDLQKKSAVAPQFVTALQAMSQGRVVPVPGGVILRDASGTLVGGVGVSGDTGDNDEQAAVAAIVEFGLVADTGA